MGVNYCCWNGKTIQGYTLKAYYDRTTRHKRMADYVAGSCAKVNWQAGIGHAIMTVEAHVDSNGAGSNWMGVSTNTASSFINSYWSPNNRTGRPNATISDIQICDAVNAAAAMWYFNSLSLYTYGYSWQGVQWRATQYNFGPNMVPTSCQPQNYGGVYKPSAYAWTIAFLAWGSNYASVSDARYTTKYAQYATGPVGFQSHFFNDTCVTTSNQLNAPTVATTYATQRTPYGRRDGTGTPGKHIVILARTDVDYISALTIEREFYAAYGATAAVPVVTADTYFAVDSLKAQYASKQICVIALGSAAKADIQVVFPGATAYSSFSAWSNGSSDGYVNASGSTDTANYDTAMNQAVAAWDNGY